MKKFLNLLFGKSSEQEKASTVVLEEILNLEDETGIAIEIAARLYKKSKNDNNFESLNATEKNILYIDMLEWEVTTGGVNQFFFQSSGDYAHETLKALEEINALQVAELLNGAIKAFPILPIPKDTERRREYINDIPENVSEIWNKMDKEFNMYSKNLTKLVVEYIKANRGDLE